MKKSQFKNMFALIIAFFMVLQCSQSLSAFDTYTVIPPDNRGTLTSTTSTPHSGVVRMRIKYNCSECTSFYKGTGFFISDNCLLTAAHVLKCTEHFAPANYIEFLALKNDSSYGLYRSYSIDELTYYINPLFTSLNAVAYDYCYIKFPTNIGSGLYHFPLEEADTSLLGNKSVLVAGFSGNTYYICSGSTCGYNLTTNLIYHTVDTEGGQSGSPMYYYNHILGKFVAIGIHSRGYDTTNTDTSTYYNKCWRITNEFIQALKSQGLYSD